MPSLEERLGLPRVVEPARSLPQGAQRLDPDLPLRPAEMEIAVDTLCLDSTSFRQLAESNGGAEGVGAAVLRIVGERGKMHNPVTGSGGILIGTVAAIGAEFPDAPPVGSRIVGLGSLTLMPLRLENVADVDPRSASVAVEGTAYLAAAVPWAYLPEDLPRSAAISAFDVCNAASETRSLARHGVNNVLVLGGGHAGLLAVAAGREALGPDGKTILADYDEAVCERARRLGLCDVVIRTDLRDPVGALETLEAQGLGPADLTVVVVNATGCEPAAILMTADTGTVLFFSMATSFTAAALSAEGMTSTARMLVGSGYAPDRGGYALDLLRRFPELQDMFV